MSTLHIRWTPTYLGLHPPTMTSKPDHETFPHATGPALETVNKHQHESDLTLWGSWFCPFVQRVQTPIL